MKRMLLAALGLWVMLCGAAAAQPTRWGLDVEAPSYFQQGAWTLDLTGGYIKDWDRGDSHLGLLSLGLGHYVRNTLALRVEAVGYVVDQRADDAVAGGLNLGLRQHLLNRGDWSLYIEGVAGIIQASRQVPPGGTHFNFTQAVGLGMTWRVSERAHLIGGARYVHISNARIRGRARNPTLNGWSAYAGVMWEF